MWCLGYRRLLVPYSEDALDGRTREKVERHVSACQRCAADLAAVRCVSGALRSLDTPVMEPAPDLWAKVSARVADEQISRAPLSWGKAIGAVSACAGVAAIALLGFGLIHNPPQKPAEHMIAQNPKVPYEVKIAKAPVTSKTVAPVAQEAPKAPAKHIDTPKQPNPKPAEPKNTPRRLILPRPKPIYVARLSTGYSFDKVSRNYSSEGYLRRSDNAELEAKEKLVDDISAGREMTVASAPAKRITASEDAVTMVGTPSRSGSTAYGMITDADTTVVPTVGDKSGKMPTSPIVPAASIGAALKATTAPVEDKRVTATNDESVVDTLNETEGVRTAALFAYP